MKKFNIILIILVLQTFFSFSQELEFPKNYVYISPFSSIGNLFQISYERRFNDSKDGVLINIGFQKNPKIVQYNYSINDEIQYRHYIINYNNTNDKKLKSNLYFGAYFEHRFYMGYEIENMYWGTGESVTLTLNSFNSGIISGYKLVLQNFSCEVYIGGGYRGLKYNIPNFNTPFLDKTKDANYKGVLPRIGFNIGFCF